VDLIGEIHGDTGAGKNKSVKRSRREKSARVSKRISSISSVPAITWGYPPASGPSCAGICHEKKNSGTCAKEKCLLGGKGGEPNSLDEFGQRLLRGKMNSRGSADKKRGGLPHGFFFSQIRGGSYEDFDGEGRKDERIGEKGVKQAVGGEYCKGRETLWTWGRPPSANRLMYERRKGGKKTPAS